MATGPAPLGALTRSPGAEGRRRGLSQLLAALPFLLPTMIGFFVFIAGPVLAAFILGFTKWDLFTSPTWVGLGNYGQMAQMPLFWRTVRNTFQYTILYLAPGVILPLLVAIFMNQRARAISIYRSVFFLPVVTSTVAVALVWFWLYNPEFGAINYFLALVGIKGPMWLASPRTAMISIVIMSVWKGLGYTMVIYLAGLQGVPAELCEAAAIDGATRWRRHLHVTLPLMTPTIFFVVVTTVMGSLQVFEQTYILTQGGPAYSTTTLSWYIYVQAFQWLHMGFGCALAYVLFFIIMVLTLIQFRLQKAWVFYG
ncbi:MAG: sugar ABC transporter permease [Anaerolineae bacterium]|nr:sugar ABC transporter permease [Anaerolineae bacterium]